MPDLGRTRTGLFQDRSDSGRRLGAAIAELRASAASAMATGRADPADPAGPFGSAGSAGPPSSGGVPIVLGLPRGGVVVAAEVANVLRADLDALPVRKIGLPENRELAIGAVTLDGPPLLNPSVVASADLRSDDLDALVEQTRERVRKDNVRYRGGRPAPAVRERTVILVDDGAATGATMRAAVAAMREAGAAQVLVGLPVAPRETLRVLETEADAVVCLKRPLMFRAVGWAYETFAATPDQVVRDLLGTPATGSAWPSPGDRG
jgi:putative phosphoribosyl transferase